MRTKRENKTREANKLHERLKHKMVAKTNSWIKSTDGQKTTSLERWTQYCINRMQIKCMLPIFSAYFQHLLDTIYTVVKMGQNSFLLFVILELLLPSYCRLIWSHLSSFISWCTRGSLTSDYTLHKKTTHPHYFLYTSNPCIKAQAATFIQTIEPDHQVPQFGPATVSMNMAVCDVFSGIFRSEKNVE